MRLLRLLRPWRRLAETLLIAAAGGWAFAAAGLPAGLVSGSIVAVATAALLGRPMTVTAGLTRSVLVIVGIALGSVVTPETVQGLVVYPASIAILGLGTLCIIAGTAFYLRAVHGWSPLSALFGASPGALSQVMALSAENDVDLPAIMVVQSLRLTILAAGLPMALSVLGMTAALPAGAAGAGAGASIADLLLMVAGSTLAAFGLFLVRFPGAWVFGAMIGSAALHGTGWTSAVLPWWITDAAMVALGAVTGSRFAGTSARLLSRHLLAGFGAFAVSATVAALFVAVAVALAGLPSADLAVAYAPGAQETMMLLALALQLDPVLVGAHHLFRFLLVSLVVPILAGILIRRRPGPPAL